VSGDKKKTVRKMFSKAERRDGCARWNPGSGTVFICGAPGVVGNCDPYAYPDCVAADLLADPGGEGRPTGFRTGVTGCGAPPPLLPEAEVPVSVFIDHAGLDT